LIITENSFVSNVSLSCLAAVFLIEYSEIIMKTAKRIHIKMSIRMMMRAMFPLGIGVLLAGIMILSS